MTELSYFFKGLLTYQDTVDLLDFVLRTMIWIVLLSLLFLILKKIYSLFLTIEKRNSRRIRLIVVEKKDNTYKEGYCTGFTFAPGIINHELILECPDSGINFSVNSKKIYESVKIGEYVNAKIEDLYCRFFLSRDPMEFFKYELSDVKRDVNE